MKYELSSDDWHFIIEANIDKQYRPDTKFNLLSKQDTKDYQSGQAAFYELIICSFQVHEDGLSDDFLTHYVGGALLPADKDEFPIELENMLNEDGILEHVLKHWELQDLENGPEWRQGP